MVKIELLNKQHVIKEPEHKRLMDFFGMIRTYPKNASFATQNEGEYVVIILRQHFIMNLGWIINSIFLFLAPTIFNFVFRSIDFTFFQGSMSANEFIVGLNSSLGIAFVLFYYGLCVSMTLFNFLHWYFDLFIITNERFISIDFDIIKGQTITDIPLQDIIDISEKMTNGYSRWGIRIRGQFQLIN